MRVKYTGVVESIRRQPSRRDEEFPTLINVKFDVGQPGAALYKSVPCPTCGMGIGGRCVSEIIGAPGQYRMVGYHVARRRAAAAPSVAP